MLLLEIAAQGVRGFAPPGGRVALRPGYNVVAGDGGVVRRLVTALFHVDLPADRSLGNAGAPVRGGLTLAGDDGATWRVVRDLAGPCQLQRYDAARRAFQSVEQEPARCAEVLRGAGVPAPGRFGLLLSIAASDFPSRQPAPGLAATSRAPTPPPRPMDEGEARRKLEALREELGRARAAEQVQARLDASQSRLFKLEEMLKSGEQVRERLRAAEATLSGLAAGTRALEALQDPAGRIAAFQRSTARRDEALGKIAKEREAQPADGGGTERPLWRGPAFLGGAGVAAAALVAGVATPLHAVALLAIPASGVAAVEGLRWVGRAEKAEEGGRRLRWLADRERKAIEAWERETQDVRAAVVAAGVANVGELSDLLGRVQEARAAIDEARAGIAGWEARAETQDAEAERAKVQQEIGELEHQLTVGTGGFVRDTHSLEVEIARLEHHAEAPGAFREAAERPTPAPGGDPLRTLVERGAAELGTTPGGAMRAMQPRVQQLLPLLSAQRLGSLVADERGSLQVQAGGRLVPVATLPPPDRDLCFAVVKLGFVEQALSAGPGVAVLDDGLSVLPEGARRVVARFLKQIARGRQVLHVTSDPIFREAADSAG